jgi:hypothetical protein
VFQGKVEGLGAIPSVGERGDAVTGGLTLLATSLLLLLLRLLLMLEQVVVVVVLVVQRNRQGVSLSLGRVRKRKPTCVEIPSRPFSSQKREAKSFFTSKVSRKNPCELKDLKNNNLFIKMKNF